MTQVQPRGRSLVRQAYPWLNDRVADFVRGWRRLDAWANRPLPTRRRAYWKLLAPDRYPWYAPALFLVLTVMLALGPTMETDWPNLILLVIGLVLFLGLNALAERRQVANNYLLTGQLTCLVAMLALLLWSSLPEVYGEMVAAPRLHVGVAVVLAITVALAAAFGFAAALFRSTADGGLADALPEVELFLPKDRYSFVGGGAKAAFFSALAIAPVRYPVELLLPGSLLTLFVPDHLLALTFLFVGGIMWILLFLGILFERLMEILKTLGRMFFIGPQRVISILVIAVAGARLAEIHFITYLFNGGSTGYGNPVLMLYILLSYACVWYYGFWTDQFVARRLMRMLTLKPDWRTAISVAYPYHGDPTLSRVESEGRTISLHGAGRLKLRGHYEDGYAGGGTALQFMTPAELIGQFRRQIELRSRDMIKADDLLASLRNFERAAVIYPVIVGTLAFGLIVGPIVLTFYYAVQPPELTVHAEGGGGRDALAFMKNQDYENGDCSPLKAGMPRIAIAASGGGTRAAIYTASLLRGLAEAGHVCDVVMASGVSGGSAALAYFGLHEAELRSRGGVGFMAWERYSREMAHPYIEDVINRASDLRITFGRFQWRRFTCGEPAVPDGSVSGLAPARSKLGHILAESFVCRMGAGKMGDVSFGLMLNSSIVGSYPDPGNPCRRGDGYSLPEQASRCQGLLDGAGAGGRLVLTNIGSTQTMQANTSPGMEIVTIDEPDVSVSRAAALSANFPPVFPDAAVDIMPSSGTAKRYWVTDGGTVENRGTVTMYRALRDAARREPKSCGGGNSPRFAPLHVIVADVSALAGPYSESFGFDSVLGAGGQLGLGMEAELRADLKTLYETTHCSKIYFHDIVIPPVFSSNGGIGTHWLLPGSMTFRDPNHSGEQVTLHAEDVEKLVLSLHSSRAFSYQDNGGVKRVLGWAQDGPGNRHRANWVRLLDMLNGKLPPQL